MLCPIHKAESGRLPHDVFVKTVRNRRILRLPREVKIHQIAMAVQESGAPFTARLLGYQRGLFRSTLSIERLKGERPDIDDLSYLAELIPDLEQRSMRVLAGQKLSADLDFYHSGAGLGKRYAIDRITADFRGRAPELWPCVEPVATACSEAIDRHEQELALSPPVLCHLDHFPKNFIKTERGIFLIDWGEGYIGRTGFDAGCFLMIMLRSYTPAKFKQCARSFRARYLSRVPDQGSAKAGIDRIFLARSLWFLLRPDTLDKLEHEDGLNQWRERLSLLQEAAG